ncbi:MAG: type secretion system domain protein [Firmicutes bacterium]|nr:type secretion system domain protein [Bacillota bacterium]
MPGKVFILKIIGVILNYGLVVLLYYFMFRLFKIIYCEFKNAPIGRSASDYAAAKEELEEQARLVVVSADKVKLSQSVYMIGETASIGRGEGNAIVIDENFVSHEHACITRYKQSFRLTDLKSTNGTFLNKQRVKDEVQLKQGDIITIGSASFRFER